MSRGLFGTDGVRGRANTHPMTAEMALRLGAAAGRYFRRDGRNRHRVVIGKDTRLSGYMIEPALTAGFISKWYLLQAAIEKGWWLAIAAILISSLLAIIYIWRVVEAAYFQPRDKNAATVSEAPWSMLAPMWILIALSLFFGVQATLTMDIATGAAEALLGGIQ